MGRLHEELLNSDLQRQLLGTSILYYCFYVCPLQGDLSGSCHLTTMNQYLRPHLIPTTYLFYLIVYSYDHSVPATESDGPEL